MSIKPLNKWIKFFGIAIFLISPITKGKVNGIEFKELLVTTPYQLTQEVIVADLLPEHGKELITFTVDEEGNRWLIIYQLNTDKNQYDIKDKVIIPKRFYRFDLSKSLNKEQQNLYFLSSTHIAIYNNKQFKKVTNVHSLFVHEYVDFLSRGDFIQDLNNDDFDDIVVADFNKTHVFIGQGLNSFYKQALPIKPRVSVRETAVNYIKSKVYFGDVNFDNKTDVLLVNQGEITVYSQYNEGQFFPTPTRIEINSMISGTDWWNKRDESGNQPDQSDLTYRKLEEIRDVNGDGVIDMVVRYTKASGVFDRVNDFEIYYGKNIEDQLTFKEEADTVIRAEGTLTDLVFVDINNDDKQEVLLSGFDIGLSQIIGALVTGAIDQDVYIFKMSEQSEFSEKAIMNKEVELTFSLSSGQSGMPIVKLADLNGDGLKDLVLSNDDDELRIYTGKSPDKKKRFFNKRKVRYKTALPKNGEQFIVEDLDGDSKEDLLMQFSYLDGKESVNKFKVLFSL